METKLLTVKEFAGRAKISLSSIYNLVKMGNLKHVKIGGSIRIPESRLYEVAEANNSEEMKTNA